MFLPIGTQLGGYTIEKQLVKTDEYCTYEMKNEFGKVTLACEFYPDGISHRHPDTGIIVPSEGLEGEFSAKLKEFKDKVNAVKSMSLGPLIKVIRTLNEKNDN